MELNECIRERRSIRRFTSKDVEESLITQLLENARISPSAKNRQLWRFRVLFGYDKNQIAEIMHSTAPESTSVKQSAYTIYEAPVLILVLKPSDVFGTQAIYYQ